MTDSKPAVEAIMQSSVMLQQWNALPEPVKSILGNNQNFLSSAEGAQQALATWNMMTPSQIS